MQVVVDRDLVVKIRISLGDDSSLAEKLPSFDYFDRKKPISN